MRSALIALMLTFATQAGAECGNLCDYDWWKTVTEADVQAELDGGADVMARDEYGTTPLHLAAGYGPTSTIQTLIDVGADVMAGANFSITPLHEAAQYGTPANTQALLAGGADVMARDEGGGTPLHHAAGSLFNDEASANIQALIVGGADAKAKSKYGNTPWELAQENEKLKGTKGYWALNDAQYN